MAIIPVTKDDFELFTVVATPRRDYISGSSGVTGSIKVFARESSIEKEKENPRRAFDDVNNSPNLHVDANFSSVEKMIFDNARKDRSKSKSITQFVENYFDLVSAASKKTTQVLDINRFVPTTQPTKYTLVKNHVKNSLMSYYKGDYNHTNWAYTNYHSLNFFTINKNSRLIPTASAIMYPNTYDARLPSDGNYASGSYCLSGAFSFDFHINPRYQYDGLDSGHFKDGTIFHLSSSYALSLITGSVKDGRGWPLTFRLKLQLSHSADIAPSLALPGSFPNDLVFTSEDNSLDWNKWHHVVIRWGTNTINNGTGSFIINGVNRGNFVIPSGTVNTQIEPYSLCVGNYYDGIVQGLMFGPTFSQRDGVLQLTPENIIDFYGYKLDHPLKAEIHGLSIKKYYMSLSDIITSSKYGMSYEEAKDYTKVSFCVPPFFVEKTPIKRFVDGDGGVLQTPFFSVNGTTDDPFNVALAYGVNGHYINLDNFTKDFATDRFPRLINLSGSLIDYTTQAQEANSFLYAMPNVPKRNLTILPCDDGTFDPNYDLLNYEYSRNGFIDSFGIKDISCVSLENLVSTSSKDSSGIGVYDPENPTWQNFSEELVGPSPETPGVPAGTAYQAYINNVSSSIDDTDDDSFDRGIQQGTPLTVYQRLLDNSSNQVTFFNISNLYYGTRIYPGSFVLTDSAISGSGGAIKITLKDDGLGNLYRADCNSKPAKFNSIGNIFYDEGLVVIKNPHLYFFGKSQYEISFKGHKNVFSTKYEILAGQGQLNSSSNTSYNQNKTSLAPSGELNDVEPFVYISGIYFHDENMNVVAKAKLAQPVMKREKDKILFKVAFDF